MPFRAVAAERRLEALEMLRTLREVEAWQERWTQNS